MVLYEYPFNESTRTLLRLERLFDRMGLLMERAEAVDHHFALTTLFEAMDVASRADVKADLLKELERHRSVLQGYRGHPHIEAAMLEGVLGRIETAVSALAPYNGKSSQALLHNDWLMDIRHRMALPGGTCEFDLPAYHAWQQLPLARRQADLQRWAQALQPLAQALHVQLSLLRDGGHTRTVTAQQGLYQQNLPAGRPYQLLRLRLAREHNLVPEIGGHRLMVSVRLMLLETDGRLRPSTTDTSFELALCA